MANKVSLHCTDASLIALVLAITGAYKGRYGTIDGTICVSEGFFEQCRRIELILAQDVDHIMTAKCPISLMTLHLLCI